MLKTRVITAVILLVGLLAALFFLPSSGWLVFCALLCAGAAWEWGGLAGWGQRGRLAYGAVLGVLSFFLGVPLAAQSLLASVFPSVLNSYGNVLIILYALAILYVLTAGFWVLVVPFWLRYKWRLQNWSAVLVGFVVLVPPTLAFAWLRNFSPAAVLAACAVAWVADIVAYFTGRAFGRTRLAPNISPGKTWAGAIGAVLGVLIYCNIITLGDFSAFNGNVFALIMLQFMFICVAVLSIVGDLFESLLKRLAGVKDSSSVLPGHGGILDRIDSLTSVLPLIVVFCMFLLTAFH
jgi:phosphatidate cytidylyltransferase